MNNPPCYDPIVTVHTRALLLGDPRGRTAYLEADLRDPESILRHPALSETLISGSRSGFC